MLNLSDSITMRNLERVVSYLSWLLASTKYNAAKVCYISYVNEGNLHWQDESCTFVVVVVKL